MMRPLAFLLVILAVATPVAAAVTADQAARTIAKEFSVQVLRVTAERFDGRKVFRVTFMVPPGNRNDAFRVTSVLVDAESGRLVRQFRHRRSGYDLPKAPVYRSGPTAPDSAERGFIWR